MRNLSKYIAYILEVEKLRRATMDLESFSKSLKYDPYFRKLRSIARAELSSIYNLLKSHFDLPGIKIYMPIRKKVSVQGRAFYRAGIPTEIRVYHVKGCSSKPYSFWTPADLACQSVEETFETFIHKVAHVLEAKRTGQMSHEKPFVDAYIEIETFLKQNGFPGLDEPSLQTNRCPYLFPTQARCWQVPDAYWV